MSKQLLSEEEAVNEVRSAINSVSGKRWMIAVWCADRVEGNGRLMSSELRLANRTTWCFPHELFEESFRLLRENLDEEMQAGEPPVPTPLEIAPFALDTDGVSDVSMSDEEIRKMGIGPKKDDPHLDELPEPPKGGDTL